MTKEIPQEKFDEAVTMLSAELGYNVAKVMVDTMWYLIKHTEDWEEVKPKE